MIGPARALFLAIALLALSVSSSSGAAEPARWQSRQAESALAAAVWADHRIVVGATCVGLDPIRRRLEQFSTSFSCRMNVWTRPARVPLARWDEMAAAFRKRDLQRIYALLGVSATATPTEVEAAALSWGLERVHPVASGLKVISPARWRSIRPAIAATAFDRSVAARQRLLNAIPAIEAYYTDNQTYAGMTLSTLRRIDVSVDGRLAIVRATALRYCVELTAASTTWSSAGPGGAPSFRRCS